MSDLLRPHHKPDTELRQNSVALLVPVKSISVTTLLFKISLNLLPSSKNQLDHLKNLVI